MFVVFREKKYAQKSKSSGIEVRDYNRHRIVWSQKLESDNPVTDRAYEEWI
jgi:hypothetical protein